MLTNNSDIQGPIIHLRGCWEYYGIIDRLLTSEPLKNESALVDVVVRVDELVAILFDDVSSPGQCERFSRLWKGSLKIRHIEHQFLAQICFSRHDPARS
jgi:hypothetical protein